MSWPPTCAATARTRAPADIAAYTIFDTVGDMVALVPALGEKQAVIVGHDWGAPEQYVPFQVLYFVQFSTGAPQS